METTKEVEKVVTHIATCGSYSVAVEVNQPRGGRYVCDIRLEGEDWSLALTDLHCDIAETLRDGLSEVIEEFHKGYEE